jgi:hypothetical protein
MGFFAIFILLLGWNIKAGWREYIGKGVWNQEKKIQDFKKQSLQNHVEFLIPFS